jgi:two-component system cell cycle sensor histidine kinase/response regulator CckA
LRCSFSLASPNLPRHVSVSARVKTMAPRSPIFRKLLGSSFLVIVLTFLGVDFYLTRYATQKVQDHITERLEYEARILAPEVEGLPLSQIEPWAHGAESLARARVTVINKLGVVLADSQHDPETMENHGSRPEIRMAMEKGLGRSIRHSATVNMDLFYLAIRARAGGDAGSVLRLAVPLEELNAEITKIHWRILEASIIAVLAAFGLAFFFSRYLTLRIERLRVLAQKLSEARPLDESIPLQDDELGGLERSLQRTSRQISGLVDRLRLESAQRSAILTGMVEGVLAVDADLRVTFCNESFARSMNAPFPLPDKLPLVDLVREPQLIDTLKRVLAGGPIEKHLLQLSVAEEKIYCEVQTMPVNMPSGAGALALLQDITQRKQAEEALQKEKAFSEAIMASLPGAFFVIDQEGRLIRWNKSAENVGYSPQQLMGMEAHSVVAPEERSHIRARWQQAFAEGTSTAEAHIVTTDGRAVPYLFTAQRAVIGSNVYVIGTGIDITERKQMMEALNQSDQRYREFISHTSEGVWRLEFKQPIPSDLPEDEMFELMRRYGYLAECNDALAHIVGASSAAELVGARFDDLIPQSDTQWVERARSLIRSGFKSRTIEFHYINRQGQPRDVQRTEIPIIEKGMLKRMWGITRDITEHKQAGEALRQSELRFRGLVENSPLPMLITTVPPEEKTILMNRRFTELFGYTLADVPDVESWWPRAYPDATQRERVRREWEESIAKAKVAGRDAIDPVEAEITCLDGSRRQVEVHLNMYGDGALVIFNDLTDRKKAEQAVRESEELLRQMAVNSPYAFILWDVRTERHIYINPAYETIWGQTPESLYADVDGWKKAVHPEDHARMERRVLRDFQSNPERQGIEDEFRVIRPDGSMRWVHMNRFPVRNEVGDVYRIGCVAQDITDRKQAAEALHKEKAFTEAVIDSLPGVFYVVDVEGKLVRWNQNAKILGYSPEELLGMGPLGYIAEDERALMTTKSKEALERGSVTTEANLLRKDGRKIPYFFTGVRATIGDSVYIVGTGIDITERKLAEEALRKGEERFRQMAENSPYMFWLFDLRAEKLLYVSPAYETIWGRKIEDFYAYPQIWREALHPEDRERITAEFDARAMTVGDENEYRILLPDGSVRWLHGHSFPLRDAAGEVDRLAGIIYDITDRKRAEAALQREKAFSETIIDSLPGVFYIVDQRGEVIRWNKNTEQILGYSKEELDALQSFDVIAEEDRDFLAAKWQRAFAEGSAVAETHLLTKEGRKIPFLLTALRTVIDDHIYVVGTGIDISERKQAEEALQEEKAFTDVVIDSLPGAFFVTDRSGKMVRWNRNSEKLLGYSGEELAALGPQGTVAVDEREFAASMRNEAFAEGSAMLEVNLLAKDSRKIPCLVRGMSVVLGDNSYVVGMALDITERKHAEESLRQREKDLEEAQRLAQVGSWVWDVNTDSLVWSKELYRISGLDPKLPPPSYSKDFPQRYSPGTWKQLNAAVENVVQTGAPFQLEMEIKRPESPTKWVIARGEAVRDASGETQQVRGTVQDITERKLGEESLRQREMELEEAQRLAKMGSWAVDIATRTVTFSVEHYRIFGLDPNGPVPSLEEIAKHYSPETWAQITNAGRQAFETGTPFKIDGELRLPDGTKKWVVVHGEVERNSDETPVRYRGTVQDISERMQAEEALRASEASLAKAQRIAHIGNWEWDIVTNEEQWSDEMYRLMGLEPGTAKPTLDLFLGFVHPEDRERLVREGDKAQKGEKVLQSEYRIIRGDGLVRHLQMHAEVIRDEAGIPVRMVGTTQDLTERKRAEENVRISEARYRVLIEGAPEAIVVVDMDSGRFVDFNENAMRLFGLSEKELLKVGPVEVSPQFQPDGRSSAEAAMEYLLKAKARDNPVFEWVHRSVDGKEIPCEVRLARLPSAGGTLVRGSITDITERKRAEETLVKLKKAVDTSGEVVFMTDREGLITSVNPEFTRLYGYTEQEVVGKVTPRILKSGSTSQEEYEQMWKAILEKRPYQNEIINKTKDGRLVNIETSISAILGDRGEILGSLAIQRDIAERKRAEEERSRLASIVKSSGDAIVGITPDGLVSDWNAAAERVYGFAAEELLGRPISVIALPGGEKEIPAFLEKIKREERISDFEAVNIRKNGEHFPASLTMFAIRDRQGKVLGFSGIIRDITERKRAEVALRASEERYRLLFERSLAGVVRTNPGGEILECNEAFARIYGFASREEALSTNAKSLYFEERDRTALLDLLKQQKVVIGQESHSRRKDGTPAWVLVSASLIEDEKEGSTVLATVFDITQWKELGEQLRQAQKMEAVGRLAGGVAHDFNNMLQIINGYSELVLDQLSPGDASHGHVQEIKSVVERAANLTRQLLAFSRQQVLAPQVLDLNVAIGNLSKMLRRLIGEDVELKIIEGKDLGRVKTDPGQIDQVILNLAVNARDAMPKGGKLTIETSNVLVDKAFALGHFPMTPGPYVMISVTDTGQGMDAATKARIFEPFFTTKKSQGTGLGLATVYGIIKQSGGFIWVESEVGKGTTFNIYLPPVKAAPTSGEVKAAPTLAGGTETVLLVEDDETIRSLVRRGLQARGYRVLEAHNGREALRVADKHQGPIHLLMTDVVMPGMGGRELAERLTRLRGEMKTLYMSGYADDALLHHGSLSPGTALLQKPFTTDQMARTVRRALKKSYQQ